MLQFSEKLLNNLMQIGLTASLAALVLPILRRLMKSVIRLVWCGRFALRLSYSGAAGDSCRRRRVQADCSRAQAAPARWCRATRRRSGRPDFLLRKTPTRWVTGTQAQTLSAQISARSRPGYYRTLWLTLWLAGVIACVPGRGLAITG